MVKYLILLTAVMFALGFAANAGTIVPYKYAPNYLIVGTDVPGEKFTDGCGDRGECPMPVPVEGANPPRLIAGGRTEAQRERLWELDRLNAERPVIVIQTR